MTPGISVLVPAYNDAPYLADALGSVARQSFTDVEIIVSDDASHDATATLADDWARDDGRIRVLRNALNLGMTDNWNRALREARAPLVFKLDADDALEPETLARLRAALEREPEALFAGCRTVECDATLEPREPFHGEGAFRKANLDPARDLVMPGWAWFELSFDDYQLWHSSAQLHRRENLLAAGGWDPAYSCASDTDLLLRMMATVRPVAHVGHVGVRYRRRPGSVSCVFAQRGWQSVEASVVAVLALQGVGRAKARRSGRLRRSWWRFWRNARRFAGEAELLISMPERPRSRLLSVLGSLRPPPVDVRLEGALRDAFWRLRQRRSTQG